MFRNICFMSLPFPVYLFSLVRSRSSWFLAYFHRSIFLLPWCSSFHIFFYEHSQSLILHICIARITNVLCERNDQKLYCVSNLSFIFSFLALYLLYISFYTLFYIIFGSRFYNAINRIFLNRKFQSYIVTRSKKKESHLSSVKFYRNVPIRRNVRLA